MYLNESALEAGDNSFQESDREKTSLTGALLLIKGHFSNAVNQVLLHKLQSI